MLLLTTKLEFVLILLSSSLCWKDSISIYSIRPASSFFKSVSSLLYSNCSLFKALIAESFSLFIDERLFNLLFCSLVNSFNFSILLFSSTTFSFKIINPQTTVHTFDISSGNNFKVISIEKKIDLSEETDFVPLPLQSVNEVWLSAEDESTGTGFYRITLQAYVEGLKQYRNFSFNVWLSSAVPSITASIAFGTATTDPITLTYNEKTIFDSIGESKIVINDVVITNITSASIDENKTFTIDTSGEYWIQILTDDDKLVASYKLTKNEPLNSSAKIVIIVVVCVAIALTIIFIIIRRKTKFK